MNIVSTSVALLLAAASAEGENRKSSNATEVKMTETAQIKNHPYVGMWVTGDGHVRQELLPNGRYDEARGNRKSAYQGRYEVKGNHIDYWDDTGFTADGEFVDDVLYQGGLIFYRDKLKPRNSRAPRPLERGRRACCYRFKLPKIPRTMARPTEVATERAALFIAASITVSRW